MYCNQCGTQLPDEAIYCMKCGKAQKEGTKTIDSDVRWETCEIEFIVVEGGRTKALLTSLRPSQMKWVANAIGPNGKYVAGESTIFEGTPYQVGNDVLSHPFATINSDNEAKKKFKIAESVLDDFVTKLSKDGWDYVGKHGDNKWEMRFRRYVK